MRHHSSSSAATFAVLAAATASFAMLQSLVSPVLPTIQSDLQTTQSTVTWVLTAWLLSASVATPVIGRIGDLIGKERTLLIALGAIAVGSAMAALAPNISVLLLARVVQGVGGAVYPISFGIIRDEFPATSVPRLIGRLSAVIAAGGGVGTVIAGPVVEALSWRWLFVLSAVLVAVTAMAAHRFVPESPVRAGGRIGWLSALTLAAWLIALLVPLSKAPAWGWQSPTVVLLFIASAIFFASWVYVELRSSSPLVDMRMMQLPAVWTANLVALLFGAGMFAVVAFVPIFVQMPNSTGYGFGLSVTEAGLLMLPLLVTMALGGYFSGPMLSVLSPKAQLLWGSMFGTLSAAGLAFWHEDPWKVAVSVGIFGLGLGLGYAATTTLIVTSVPAHQTGAASGMNANIRNIGGSIGTAVFSSIVSARLIADGLPAERGFTVGFAVLTVSSLVTFCVALLVPAHTSGPSAAAGAQVGRTTRTTAPTR